MDFPDFLKILHIASFSCSPVLHTPPPPKKSPSWTSCPFCGHTSFPFSPSGHLPEEGRCRGKGPASRVFCLEVLGMQTLKKRPAGEVLGSWLFYGICAWMLWRCRTPAWEGRRGCVLCMSEFIPLTLEVVTLHHGPEEVILLLWLPWQKFQKDIWMESSGHLWERPPSGMVFASLFSRPHL